MAGSPGYQQRVGKSAIVKRESTNGKTTTAAPWTMGACARSLRRITRFDAAPRMWESVLAESRRGIGLFLWENGLGHELKHFTRSISMGSLTRFACTYHLPSLPAYLPWLARTMTLVPISRCTAANSSIDWAKNDLASAQESIVVTFKSRQYHPKR